VEGEKVADLLCGFADAPRTRVWEQDTIVNVYSTPKTMAALTALLVAECGELDFDAPVARYRPQFAANGKAEMTVAQVMSHSAGLSGWREPLQPEDAGSRRAWRRDAHSRASYAASTLAAMRPVSETGYPLARAQ
jgi:CubicO group peptidase (beta-lactamase class C family)